ncbi:MAG TPA: hypothetical protein DD424_09280 [Porphyromonadaceae bacterium]|nr:hypothetical protein [Porphyromonadaceae bacterium]
MNAKDKEYIDRQTNQLRSDINQLSERLVSLECRPVEPRGSDIIKVEVDMTQFRSIVEEYFNQTIKNFDSKQSELFSYYDDMAKKLNENITHTNERYKLIHTSLVLIYKKFLSSKTAQKPQQQPVTTPQPSEIHPRLFASHPSGIRATLRELRHRFASLIRSWFTGHFSFPRGYTIFSLLLYLALFLLLAIYRLSITIN